PPSALTTNTSPSRHTAPSSAIERSKLPGRVSILHFEFCMLHVAFLSNVPRPLPRLFRGGGRPPHLANEDLLVRRVAGRRAFPQQVVADFEREAVDAALRELRDAAPRPAPLHLLAVLLFVFDDDER